MWGRLVNERGKPKERSDEVDEAVSDAQASDRPREAPTRLLPPLNAKRTLIHSQHPPYSPRACQTNLSTPCLPKPHSPNVIHKPSTHKKPPPLTPCFT
ncbi:hypothetical protein GCM10027288_29860 [Bordetella tumbae]